jgi:hypothetical protein
MINVTGNSNNIAVNNQNSTISINSENKENVEKLYECITHLNSELLNLKNYLAYDEYDVLKHDLDNSLSELSKPNANIVKIKNLLLSIPNVLNLIPNDGIQKTIQTIQTISNLL